jgi:phospholipid/cholesterol/gamma-HCH transport system substrate-binding protein
MPGRADRHNALLRVGGLVFIAAVILVLAIFATTSQFSWFSHRITIYTYVPDAGGMRAGAAVNLEGVAIGNVTGIHLAEHPPSAEMPVKVTMNVNPGHRRWLRTDSMVMLGTAGPLGETLVNISTGTLKAPPARNGTVLPAQPSTGISQLLVSSHDVITNANYLLKRMNDLVNQVQSGKGSIGALLYSSQLYNRFNRIAANLQTLTDNLNSGKGTAGQLLTSDQLYDRLNTTLGSLNTLLGQIEHGNGTMAKLIRDPSLYDNANQLITNLNTTTANLNAGRGALGALMTNSPTSAKLEDTIARLDAVLAKLQAGQGTVGKLIVDPALYNNLNQLTAEARRLIRAIRGNPKRYLTIHLDIF